jgi:hypothetical protein
MNLESYGGSPILTNYHSLNLAEVHGEYVRYVFYHKDMPIEDVAKLKDIIADIALGFSDEVRVFKDIGECYVTKKGTISLFKVPIKNMGLEDFKNIEKWD